MDSGSSARGGGLLPVPGVGGRHGSTLQVQCKYHVKLHISNCVPYDYNSCNEVSWAWSVNILRVMLS